MTGRRGNGAEKAHPPGKRAKEKPISSIRTVTVGSGIAPDQRPSTGKRARGLAGLCRFTAGGDFHPALRRKKHTPVMAHVKKSGYKTGLFPKYGKRPGHELVRQFNAGKRITLLPT